MTKASDAASNALSFFDKRYATVDQKLMEDGAPIDFGSGFTVDVRHVSSKAVESARAQKIRQMRVGNRNRDLSPDQQKELMHHVTAYAGIVNWSGGDAPPFTPELALELFKKKPEFLEDVLTAMTSYEAFRLEEIEETVGN